MPSFEDPLNIKEKYFFGLAEQSYCIYFVHFEYYNLRKTFKDNQKFSLNY